MMFNNNYPTIMNPYSFNNMVNDPIMNINNHLNILENRIKKLEDKLAKLENKNDNNAIDSSMYIL